MTWIVTVQEGSLEVDNATYYCDSEPEWAAMPVTGRKGAHTVVLKFVPRNGAPARVGHVNSVPRERVVAITEEKISE